MKCAFPLGACSILALLIAGPVRAADLPPVRFSRDILPILSENCFQCHGPDEKARKAKLRLDTEAGARKVVTPKESDVSKLVLRVTADAEHVMPPAKSGKTLSDKQKDLLRRWIDEGAVWGKHGA